VSTPELVVKALWNRLTALGQVIAREPVQLAGIIATLIQVFSALGFSLTVEQQGALNAGAVALFGFIAAAMVSGEKAAPAFAGLVQAILAAVLAFGVHLAPALQSSIMAFVSAGVMFYMRTQVIAPGTPTTRGRHEAMEGCGPS
jgi:hypothetical protein